MIDSTDAIPVPRSVYVHVPFCRHRCGYCNFALVAGRDHLIDAYLDCIEIEMQVVEDGAEVDTIYVGGGTPTNLNAEQLDRLLTSIEKKFRLSDGGERTVEANPEDLPGQLEMVLRDHGVNRISLGVQSFNEPKLKTLERGHDAEQIELAFQSCKRVCDNISIDLIFATPDESSFIWTKDIHQAIQLEPTHLSTYELTVEKGTQFWNRQNRGQLKTPNDEACAEFYAQTIASLAAAGYQHYEVSSFAKPGFRSRHNQVYWRCDPYWAFGPGAASFVAGVRRSNHPSLTTYMRMVKEDGYADCEVEQLSQADIALDRLVFGVRMIEGIDLASFESTSGFRLAELVDVESLKVLQDQQLIEAFDRRLKLTQQGVLFCDLVCSELLASVIF